MPEPISLIPETTTTIIQAIQKQSILPPGALLPLSLIIVALIMAVALIIIFTMRSPTKKRDRLDIITKIVLLCVLIEITLIGLILAGVGNIKIIKILMAIIPCAIIFFYTSLLRKQKPKPIEKLKEHILDKAEKILNFVPLNKATTHENDQSFIIELYKLGELRPDANLYNGAAIFYLHGWSLTAGRICYLLAVINAFDLTDLEYQINPPTSKINRLLEANIAQIRPVMVDAMPENMEAEKDAAT